SRSALRAREEELLLSRITAQVPGVIFRARRRDDGLPEFLYLSPAATTLFGLSTAAACADPTLVTSRVHRDDRAGVLAQFAHATRDATPWLSEYRMVLPGGAVHWVETRALPEPSAQGLFWNGYTADITERKRVELALRQAEQTWEMAAQADGIGIAVLDMLTGRMNLDRRACAAHGLAHPQPEYTLDDWLASLEADDRATAHEALLQAVAESKQAHARVRVRRPDGELRTIEVVAAATYDAASHALTLVGTLRDVTERLALEQLQRERDAAERASRAKSEFLSRVSHELRTPLNSILGFTQLLAHDTAHPLHSDQRRQMQSVRIAGRHLLGLIDDLLELSRIENEGVALKLRGVDLCAALWVCLGLLAPVARRSGVTLPDVPAGAVHVHANARALQQVLMNLLSNAIKFNRRGGRVDVGLEVDTEHVALWVRDEGPGITAQQQQRLFQPFERLGAEHGGVEGSGLGLVIARQLVHAMGGSLQVASEPGSGATFRLTLDAAQADTAIAPKWLAEPTAPGVFADADAAGAVAVPAAARRVLYVEDEPLNVLLMEEVIRRVPAWSMTVAGTGADGLRAARELRPDLLLIDINLPDMNGQEIVRALRADASTAQLRCIALSADAMREQVDAALAAGFEDYWLKPIDVALLIKQFDWLARFPASEWITSNRLPAPA
ncbi:MAG: ATP-binding protein, partial [Burkholderiaceae bacterium]